jgi:hypothetical protein
MKLLKIAIIGATAVVNCEGRKLRGNHNNKQYDTKRQLGKFYWIPGDATNGSGYGASYASNDFVRTNKPTRKPTKKPTNKPADPTASPIWKGKKRQSRSASRCFACMFLIGV